VYGKVVLFGVLLALGTSVAWALGNVFIQRSSHLVGGVRAMAWSLALGVVVAGLASYLLDDRNAPFTAAVLGWVALSGLTGLTAYYGLFYSLTHGQLSLVVPFTACWSLVAALFGLVVFGERPAPLQMAGAAVVLLGVLLVALTAGRQDQQRDQQGDQSVDVGAAGRSPRSRATAAALLAGISFGVMMPAMNQASPAAGNFGATALAYLGTLVLGVPLAGALRLSLAWPGRAGLAPVAAAGLFETAGFVLLTLAGRLAPVALVAPVASLASTLSVIYALVFLGERPGTRALAGALLASVGVVLLALK
jgi:drug/metabolite transporter (DMT)-like permease